MATHQHQKNQENDVEKQIEGGTQTQMRQQDKQGQEAKQSSPSPAFSAPSPSSSPSHEFSFTISLHSSSTTTIPDKSRAPPSPAVDLSPADDIFFHGHLLPLHYLSHLPASPRSSINSSDSFNLPIRELLEQEKLSKDNGIGSFSTSNRSSITMDSHSSSSNNNNNNGNREEANKNRVTKEGESKPKPAFSLFGLTRGRKGCQVRDKEDKEKHKRKLGLEVIHALKRYLRMVQPLVLFKGRKEKLRFHGQAYSYSGNLSPRNKPELLRGRRGEYSAPASMRTSPTNSGLLFATTPLPPANDSTMEELQAAIQAAIAHCKNSIAKEEKLKC